MFCNHTNRCLTLNPTVAVFFVKEKLRTALIYNYSNEVSETEGMNSD